MHDGRQVQEETITGHQTRFDVNHRALLVSLQRQCDPLQSGFSRPAVDQQRIKHLSIDTKRMFLKNCFFFFCNSLYITP